MPRTFLMCRVVLGWWVIAHKVLQFSLSKIEAIDVDKMHPFKIFKKLSQNNFTNLKDTLWSQITTLLKWTKKCHMTKTNFPLLFMECNLFLVYICVCKKATKKQQKSNKSSQKATKMCTFPSFYYYTSNFLSFEISNFGPFLFFSFNRPPQWLQKNRRYGKDGLLVLDEAPKLPWSLFCGCCSFFSSRCRAREISLDAVISQSSRAGEHVFMYVCFVVFFFSFCGFFLINFFFVCS